MTTSAELRAERLRTLLQRHYLREDISARRQERIINVVLHRLRGLTVVMENLADRHNVSAVMRTAEGLGVDAIHVVEQPNKWEKNKAISMSADRWIDVVKHQGLARCLGDLGAQGYRLYAADVGEGCIPLHKVDVTGKTALIFGSEHAGLSKRALSLADQRFTIPMHGFVESFNVSVSAAITLYDVSSRLRRHLGQPGDLSDAELVERADTYFLRGLKDPILADRRRREAAAAGLWVPAPRAA